MKWDTAIVCPTLDCFHLCFPAIILRLVGLLFVSVSDPGSYFFGALLLIFGKPYTPFCS